MTKALFDEHGRCIPALSLTNSVSKVSEDFYLIQPKINYVIRLATLHVFLGDTEYKAKKFQQVAESLKNKTVNNPELANLFKGVHLPIILPSESLTLPHIIREWTWSMENLYNGEGDMQKFNNTFDENYLLDLKAIADSRQDILIDRLQKKSIIGWYFPCALQGYSVLAQREQINYLPNNLYLSGIDTLVAMIIYADVLARDDNTPFYDLSSFRNGEADKCLGLTVKNQELLLRESNHLDYAYDDCTGGLFLVQK